MMKLAGGKTTVDEEGKTKDWKENVKKKTCRESFAGFVIDPRNPYRILFEVIMGFIYLLSYLIDPYILVFRFRPYNKPNIRILSDLCNFIILVDILVIPIMGTKKEDD